MGLIVALILIGLVLIFVEIILIPGVGVPGILGLASLAASCFYAFYELGSTAGYVVTSINFVLVLALTIYVLRAKTWKRLALSTNIDSKAVSSEETLNVGDKGKTTTRLAPVGMARIEGHNVEVKALEGMIYSGVAIEVVLIEDGKVYVMPVRDC